MWEDKETTAPDPSVAPDGEQPSALARTDSIATFEETNKQFGKMRIFSMPELMDTHFPSRPCIIENLLPAGTYLLAGAPKIGKSFLVLQMAYQVSAGEPFLGFPTLRIGKRLLVPRDKLVEWIEQNTGGGHVGG